MEKKMEIMKEARLKKEERGLQRKRAKSQPLRDSIDEYEFRNTL